MSDLGEEPSVGVVEDIYDVLQRNISKRWVTLTQQFGDNDTDPRSYEFRRMDHEIESLLMAGQCLAAKISTRVKYLKELRKKSSVLLQFPVELLVQVFSLASRNTWDEIIKEAPGPSDDYASRLHVLAQVCTRWRTIIEDTPELWSLVTFGSKNSSTIAALRWSKAYPLDIIADTASSDRLFWLLVTKEIHRWKCARLAVEIPHRRSIAPLSLKALEKPATTLTELDLFGYCDMPQEQAMSVDLFAGSVPNLLHLSLESIALRDWDSQILCGLRSISLTRILTNGPSAIQMMTVLQACPSLRSLTLESVSFSNLDLTQHPTVSLNKLQDLYLQMAPKAIISLLETIRAPNCTYNNFEVDTPGSLEIPQLLTAIKVFVSSTFQIGLAICNDIDLSISSRVRIHVPTTDGLLSLILPTLARGSEVGMQWTMTHVLQPLLSAAGKIIPINLSWAPRGRVPITDIEYLLRQPTIVSLEMKGWDAGAKDLIKALCMTPINIHGNRSWYWPALRYLDLTGCDCSPRTLLQLVTDRMEAEAETKENGVERLQRLSVRKSGMDQQTYEIIQGLIGDAVVWDDVGTEEGDGSDDSMEDD